ncbi:MAG: TetR/AcrR family transcriptional regulator [Pseudomonadales bacterium]
MQSKRAQNRLEQQERILDAARLAFADKGVDRVTMSEIANAAGVARATVFNHFPSKHALVEAITTDILQYLRDMLARALAADDATPVPTIIRAFFQHMGLGIEAYQSFYSGMFRQIIGIQLGLDEGNTAQRMRQESLDLLEQLMRRGQINGELTVKVKPRVLAEAFDSLSNGTIVHWLYEDVTDSLVKRMQDAAEVLLAPVALGAYQVPPISLPELAPGPHNPAGNLPPADA